MQTLAIGLAPEAPSSTTGSRDPRAPLSRSCLAVAAAVALVAWVLAGPRDAGAAVLGEWAIDGFVDSSVPIPSSTPQVFARSGLLVLSPSLGTATATNEFRGTGWTAGGLNLFQYFEITLGVDAGVGSLPTLLDFTIQGGVSESTTWEVRSSADCYATTLDSDTVFLGLLGSTNVSADISALGVQDGAFTLRIYLYENSGSTTRGLTALEASGTGVVLDPTARFARITPEAMCLPGAVMWSASEANGILFAVAGVPATGTLLWWSPDGLSWLQADTGSMGLGNLIGRVVEFAGDLYVGTGNSTAGGEVWRSQDDGVTWAVVATGGFGDVENNVVALRVVFDGHLYAGTTNDMDGGELWRSPDGTTWSQVGTSGLGDSDNIGVFPNLHGDVLVVTTLNQTDGFELWVSSDGTSFTRNVSGGLGDAGNQSASSVASTAGALYLSTNNFTTGAEVFRSADLVGFTRLNTDGFGDASNLGASLQRSGFEILAMTQNSAGGQIFSGTGGSTWTLIEPDGFGRPANIALVPSAIHLKRNVVLAFQFTTPGGAIYSDAPFAAVPIGPPLVWWLVVVGIAGAVGLRTRRLGRRPSPV